MFSKWFVSCLNTILSIVLPRNSRLVTGCMLLSMTSCFPFLRMGLISPVFNLFGNTPVSNDTLVMCWMSGAISLINCLRMPVGMGSSSQDLFVDFLMRSSTSVRLMPLNRFSWLSHWTIFSLGSWIPSSLSLLTLVMILSHDFFNFCFEVGTESIS